MAVRLERVGKRYGFRQPWIVRDVSLDIPPGRLIRLDGVNGSGKSTLLRIIAGVSVPTSGSASTWTGWAARSSPRSRCAVCQRECASILAIGGFCWAVVNCGVIRHRFTNTIEVGPTLSALLGGLVATLICLLVGSAVGTLCNPPLIRRPAAAMLSTTGAVVAALAWNVSPANAAVRSAESAPTVSSWPPGLPVIAAIVLLAAAWTVSALVAAHRTG